jgi:Pyruvate/2-oxoacid:ferredoxin oxidoreductase gamma subunit
MVDNDRNRLICIGYAEAYGAARRSYIFKEFALPDPTSASVITLHDSDVIEQWQVEDKTLAAFQGGTIYGKYVFVPASNETTESVFVYDKYAHRQIATIPFVKAVTQELQSASVYNGKLYVIAAEGRIDEIIF